MSQKKIVSIFKKCKSGYVKLWFFFYTHGGSKLQRQTFLGCVAYTHTETHPVFCIKDMMQYGQWTPEIWKPKFNERTLFICTFSTSNLWNSVHTLRYCYPAQFHALLQLLAPEEYCTHFLLKFLILSISQLMYSCQMGHRKARNVQFVDVCKPGGCCRNMELRSNIGLGSNVEPQSQWVEEDPNLWVDMRTANLIKLNINLYWELSELLNYCEKCR